MGFLRKKARSLDSSSYRGTKNNSKPLHNLGFRFKVLRLVMNLPTVADNMYSPAQNWFVRDFFFGG